MAERFDSSWYKIHQGMKKERGSAPFCVKIYDAAALK